MGARTKPDVVLLDIGMPVMDGHAACQAMRRTAWGERAYIVALTAWGSEVDRRKTQQAGFEHPLVKPVAREEISAVLLLAGDPHQGGWSIDPGQVGRSSLAQEKCGCGPA
ncbi:MAG: response regulator [Flavobacteriales bacterium]